jgi:hypothetical protein
MQTDFHQTDNALYDFALETAMTQIAARVTLNQTARNSQWRATRNTKIANHI